MQRVVEGDERGNSGLTQLEDACKKRGINFSHCLRFMLLQQEIGESLFEAIDDLQGRVLRQVCR
jgi:hypothetical protein